MFDYCVLPTRVVTLLSLIFILGCAARVTSKWKNMGELDWFDITNYDQCKLWTAKEWYRALWCRVMLPENINRENIDLSLFDSFFGKDRYTESEIKLKWKDFIMKLHSAPLGQLTFFNVSAEEVRTIYPSVTSLELISVCSLYRNLIGTLNPHQRAVVAGTKDDDELDHLRHQSVEDRQKNLGYDASYLGNSAIAVINLDSPDDVLISQFKNFLASRRTILGVDALEKIPSKFNFSSWAQYQILGYFDLQLFATTQRCRLTDRQIGELLFPGEFNVDLSDRIKDTTRGWVKKVFSNENLRALSA